jgi:hypothetical protein
LSSIVRRPSSFYSWINHSIEFMNLNRRAGLRQVRSSYVGHNPFDGRRLNPDRARQAFRIASAWRR